MGLTPPNALAGNADKNVVNMTFRAMNTDVRVLVPGLDAFRTWQVGRAIRGLFAKSERRFSRFRRDSEVSRLNAAGEAVVSADLFAALQRARQYWELTDGWFDPTIGASLRALGYDRSFSPGALDRLGGAGTPVPGVGMDRIAMDPASRTVRLPSGAQLDFGGFIKGWTVDQAARLLPLTGSVDAGGDAAVVGSGWNVDVEDPMHPGRSVFQVRLQDRAIATSGTNRRRWRTSGGDVHHLLDPRTGRPADTSLSQVTVVAASAELADVLAKTVFLRGPVDAASRLKRWPSVTAVLVDNAGAVTTIGTQE